MAELSLPTDPMILLSYVNTKLIPLLFRGIIETVKNNDRE